MDVLRFAGYLHVLIYFLRRYIVSFSFREVCSFREELFLDFLSEISPNSEGIFVLHFYSGKL